eukprot:ctg_923.g405
MVSGGGALAMYLENFFEAIGLLILVGYGLTETSPVVCNRRREHCVRGTAGWPVSGTEFRITDPDTRQALPAGQTGLICVRGEQVFRGYFRDAEATARAIDAERFFDTGDLGFISPHTHRAVAAGERVAAIGLCGSGDAGGAGSASAGRTDRPQPGEDAGRATDHVDVPRAVGEAAFGGGERSGHRRPGGARRDAARVGGAAKVLECGDDAAPRNRRQHRDAARVCAPGADCALSPDPGAVHRGEWHAHADAQGEAERGRRAVRRVDPVDVSLGLNREIGGEGGPRLSCYPELKAPVAPFS